VAASGQVTETSSADPVMVAGACESAWVPRELLPAGANRWTEPLVQGMAAWLRGGSEGAGARPRVRNERGVLFAKSNDDSGADGPEPSFAGALARAACGVEVPWLLSHLRDTIAWHLSAGPMRCQGNLCCYDAHGEFDSSGLLVFDRTPAGEWVLVAFAEVADNNTMGPDSVAENRRFVGGELKRLASQRCAREPAVLW
jgi:hypothetical protein